MGCDKNEISGEIINGIGFASRCIALQMPLICTEFPEIKNCHAGTINVLLKKALLFKKPDFKTEPITWANGCTEFFSFWRIKFRLTGIDQVFTEAWVYRASRSLHLMNPCLIEVIAPKIHSGVFAGASCGVTFGVPMEKISWLSIG